MRTRETLASTDRWREPERVTGNHRLWNWHPRSPNHQRAVYGVIAAALISVWYGLTQGSPMLFADWLSPLIFALATAACIVAALEPHSPGAWHASGSTTVVAATWRLLNVLWYDLGISDDYPYRWSGTSSVAVGVWTIAVVGIIALWGTWLRPYRKSG